jgi:hypothetical protein
LINKSRFTKVLIAILLIFVTKQQIYAQSSKNKFPEFLEYKKMGYSIAPVTTRPAQFNPTIGDIKVTGSWTPSLSFGLNWTAHADREVSFRYGLHFNILPIYDFKYELPDGDLPNSTNFFSNDRNWGPLYISVPLQVELKKQLGPRLYASAMGGVNIAWIPEGSVEVGASVLVEELNEVREFFELRSQTREFPLYPNLRLSLGLYFMWDKLLLQTNVVYQKSIPNYFTGEYLFDNLEISDRTEGTYSYSGDYIGLEFVFFLKKRKQRKTKKKEKTLKNVYIN